MICYVIGNIQCCILTLESGLVTAYRRCRQLSYGARMREVKSKSPVPGKGSAVALALDDPIFQHKVRGC